MAKITLTAEPATALDVTIAETRLFECRDLQIASLAVPQGHEGQIDSGLADCLGLSRPGAGQSTRTETHALLWMAQDQFFAIAFGPDPALAAQIAPLGYVTDQTDGWVVLEMAGPGCGAALERLCPVDTSDSAFPVGAVARTVMEHMGAVLWRMGPDRYWLMSARSSALSFAHAVETSLRWTA